MPEEIGASMQRLAERCGRTLDPADEPAVVRRFVELLRQHLGSTPRRFRAIPGSATEHATVADLTFRPPTMLLLARRHPFLFLGLLTLALFFVVEALGKTGHAQAAAALARGRRAIIGTYPPGRKE